MSKHTFCIVFCAIIIFHLGVFCGASDYKGAFPQIKWTDVASLLITFSGFCFAFFTYLRWLTTKKQEDAYLVAKKYLLAMDNIQNALLKLNDYYYSICPAPGLPVQHKDNLQIKMNYIGQIGENLRDSGKDLIKAKSELVFWHVKLSERYCKKHDAFIRQVDIINMTIFILNNKLYRYINDTNGETIQAVINEKNEFDKRYQILQSLTDERMKLGFEKIFQFQT